VTEIASKNSQSENVPSSQGTHEFQKKGSWFCDKEGRYILFRGLNFASRTKLHPTFQLLLWM
jgi:hypothetical protein